MVDDALVIAVVEETVDEAVGKARVELEAGLTEAQAKHRDRVSRLIEGHKAEVETTLAGLPDMVEAASKAAALPPLPALTPTDGIDGKAGTDGEDGLSINWRGPWKSGAYDAQDAVELDGSSYIATARTRAKPPKGAWDLLARKGADGSNSRTIVRGGMFGGGTSSGPGGGSDLTIKDEGSNLDTAVTSIDFVGAGVTATNVGHAVTVTIPGGSSVSPSATVTDETTYGISPAAGASAEYSRGDHTHGSPATPDIPALSDATPIIEAGAGSAGVGTEASRDDHVHPEFGGGSSDYVAQDTDPGAIGPGSIWSRPDGDGGWAQRTRNDTDDGWNELATIEVITETDGDANASHNAFVTGTGNAVAGANADVAVAGDATVSISAFTVTGAANAEQNAFVTAAVPGDVATVQSGAIVTGDGTADANRHAQVSGDGFASARMDAIVETPVAGEADARISAVAGANAASVAVFADASGASVRVKDGTGSFGTTGQVFTAQGDVDGTALWEDATGGGSGLPFTDTFTGDGVEDTFTLSHDPDFAIVVVAGSTYGPDDYTITGTSLVFTNPPTTDADGIFVYGWSGADISALDLDDLTNVDASGKAVGDLLVWDGAAWNATPNLAGISFVIDGGGAEIATGSKGYVQVPYACTITAVRLMADQTGDIELDILKANYATMPTTTTIVASAPPELTTDQKYEDTTLTGWTTSIAAGDWLEFSVVSVTDCERVTVALSLTRV